mmetsp:Transcript_24553/g.28966  ORF Transcript_24553/g.28966 Transcript_24553/m.28966 type:complete len:292 (-) Transcript_24553:307-1182(-)
MTRKGKQPGGHNPLTYHERLKLTSYGTTTARLGTESHNRFGDCCLGLAPATDPVSTPSGHIYSREAIVSYLLTKNQEIKEARLKYETQLSTDQDRTDLTRQAVEKQRVEDFATKDGCPAQISKEGHATSHKNSLGRIINTSTKEELRTSLKRTSFWLSESQPQYTAESIEEDVRNNPPPRRPDSPMSGRPLRMKELIPMTLQREEGVGSIEGKCICAVSGKAITTQPVILIKKTGVVMVKEFYDTLAKSSHICPVTGKKFKDKDVITLNKGTSGFAASGEVIAKKYRPTLT